MELDDIREMVADVHRALIVGHDYPDPDCLASAWGVKRLFADRFGLESDITFGGFIGRAGNRALVELLRIEYIPIHHVETDHYDFVVMVDTQPGTGNNSYEGTRVVDLVIDHHVPREDLAARVSVFHIDCGSTTAVVTDLLFKSGMAMDPHLVTALFLGIKTDTLALGRDFCSLDWQYYQKLFPMVDHRLLSRIERPDLPAEYFRILVDAIDRTVVFEKAAVCHLGTLRSPTAIAEFADLVLQLEGIEWVLCTGAFRGEVFFSIRMRNASGDAGELARTIVKGLGRAGGHEEMAGGRAKTETPEGAEVAHELRQRFLTELGVSPDTMRPLY
ncbi:MAG TPA: DHH family phosphoesterase [Planctomycetota bacterium]|nr:DHH family phosphoesterase [Planctomycetota bacterium]